MNQKGFANVILILVLVILVGVVGYLVFVKKSVAFPPAETPKSAGFNFIFRYGVGARNELDTFEKTYTKDMVMDPPVKVKMSLTDEEMNKIYQKMLEMHFFDYPEEFSVIVPTEEATGMIDPCETYYFRVANGSSIRELRWHDCITNKNEEADRLREFIMYIESIIESKKEYKGLPVPNGGYL